jgi:hypothetical protein
MGNLHEDLCKNVTFFTDKLLLEWVVIFYYKFISSPFAYKVTSFLAFSVMFLSIKMKLKINVF